MCNIFPSPILALPPEEVGHQKLAAQYIGRELRDADEANLLDEEGICSRRLLYIDGNYPF